MMRRLWRWEIPDDLMPPVWVAASRRKWIVATVLLTISLVGFSLMFQWLVYPGNVRETIVALALVLGFVPIVYRYRVIRKRCEEGRCPVCGFPKAEDPRLCTECGFDFSSSLE